MRTRKNLIFLLLLVSLFTLRVLCLCTCVPLETTTTGRQRQREEDMSKQAEVTLQNDDSATRTVASLHSLLPSIARER